MPAKRADNARRVATLGGIIWVQVQEPYDPKAVANYFLSESNRRRLGRLTQMKLQKLVYFAHGYTLAACNEPLINEHFEAWEYGPVVPTLYHEFKEFGAKPLPRLATDFDFETLEYIDTPAIDTCEMPESMSLVLEFVCDTYGRLSAGQLSTLTHEPSSAWDKTMREYPRLKHVDIPNELIRADFDKILTRAKEGNHG